MNIGWNASTEKLLGLLTLDDRYGDLLSYGTGGEAFFRAFIVQNRQTGAVLMRFRWRYRDGDSWGGVTGKALEPAAALAELRDGMTQVIREGAALMGLTLPPGAVECHEPPDDEGDGARTLEWLFARDLVKVAALEQMS